MTQHKYQLLCGLVFAVQYVSVSTNLINCPGFKPPKNGHMICDHLLGKYCTPSCNTGYQPANVPAWAYVCNPVTHRWATYPESYPLPWPDCIPKRKISSREHFILHNVFNPENVTSRRQLSEILLSKSIDTSSHATKDISNGDKRTPKEIVNAHHNKSITKTTTPAPQTQKPSDLKAVASRLLKDSSDTLSYVVAEEHENNRTMKNEIDVTNVTRSNINGNNEVDVENITITTTRNKVPLSNTEQKSMGLNLFFKKLKPLAQTVNAFKKQYVEYMKQNPNGFNTSNFTQFLNDEVNNATRLGEEAFNQSVVQVWGQYYKNFYQTYAHDINSRQKSPTTSTPETTIETTTTYPTTTSTTTTTTSTTPTPTITTTTEPFKNSDSDYGKEIPPKVTPKPLGVVVVLVDNSNKTNADTTQSISKYIKSQEENNEDGNEKTGSDKQTGRLPGKQNNPKGDGAGGNSTIINININNININITDAPENTAFPESRANSVGNLKQRSHGKGDDVTEDANKQPSSTTEKSTSTSTSTEPTTSSSTSTSTTKSSSTKSQQNNNGLTIADEDLTPENIKRFTKMIEDAILMESKNAKQHKNAYVRTYLKDDDRLKEIPNVTANFKYQKNGDPPLVPVFSEKDLELLRHMVDEPIPKSNTKRSELKHSISSLWTKMLRLSSSRDGRPFRIPHLGTRKELAKKDSSLAHLIMADVNGNSRYHFQQTKNPFLVGQFNMGGRKGKKYIQSNPYTRQYVWNGATYVPATGLNGPISYLNSNEGGGLSHKAKYRWNGATYVPNEEYTGDGRDNLLKLPDTNTQSDKPPTFNPQSDSKPFSEPNTESANKISSLNEPPDQVVNRNNAPDKTASFQAVDIQGQNLSNNPAEWPDNMKYFYWDGTQFLQITQTTSNNLARNEIIYKLGASGMQPINYNSTSQTGEPQITAMFMPHGTGENILPETPLPTPSTMLETTIALPIIPGWEESKLTTLNDLKLEKTLDSESVKSTTTPLLEDILQTNYPPKPPFPNEVKDLNDKAVAGDPLLNITPAPPLNGQNMPNDFKASVNYPTTSSPPNDKPKEKSLTTSTPGNNDASSTTTSTVSMTTPTTVTLTTSTKSTTPTTTLTGVNQQSTTSSTISTSLSSTSSTTGPSTETTSTSPLAPLVESASIATPPPNPLLYPITPQSSIYSLNNTSNNSAENPKNPFRQDDENVDNVIENDLNLKETLDTLKRFYDNASSTDNTPVTYPITHQGHVTDLRLLPSDYYGPFQPTRNPNIEHDIFNDLNNNKPPDVATAEKDIKAADELLQKEKNGQQFNVPAAEVKTGNANTPSTSELKQVMDLNVGQNNDVKPSDLAKVLEKSIADTQVSYTKPENSNGQVISESATPSVAASSNLTSAPVNSSEDGSFLTNLSSNAKNALEETLQTDISKLESGKIGDERDADLLTLATSTTESPSDDDNEPLTMADIRALLQLTKLAEKESTFKKQGLAYPRLTKERAMKLLRKPSIKRLVKLLVHRRLSPKVLNLLKQHKMIELKQQLLGQLSKKMIDKKRNEALKRLVTIWNKKYQYYRARNNTLSNFSADVKVNPLPKFAG